jgi:RND family efflux transporter MFP subunit
LDEARPGALQVQWTFLGEVRAKRRAQLAAGEPGTVQRVTVREGDRAEKGQLLLEVDPSLAAAQVQAAKASRQRARTRKEQARRDSERMQGAGTEAVAAAEIDRTQTEAQALGAETQQLTAELRRARARLARHKVRAPFTGVVARRSVDPGDWVDPGDPTLELVDVEHTEVLVRARPELVDYVSEGDTAMLRHGERQAAAEIRGIVPALDKQTRTVTLRLVPQQTASWIMPGRPLDAVFTIHRRQEGAVLVSRDALVLGAVGTRVVRAAEGKAKPVEVDVIDRSAEQALVRADGLAPGDAVVVRGNERLRPGQPLEVAQE